MNVKKSEKVLYQYLVSVYILKAGYIPFTISHIVQGAESMQLINEEPQKNMFRQTAKNMCENLTEIGVLICLNKTRGREGNKYQTNSNFNIF